MKAHKTVTVRVGIMEAQIDVGLAPLIEEIWKADILTLNSSEENHPGIAWIEFRSSDDASRFLDIVAGEYDDDLRGLYNRIRQEWDDSDGPVEGTWDFAIYPVDRSVDQWITDEDMIEEEPIGPPDFDFTVSIRFPREDLELLLARMRARRTALL
jgi:hypothetical protein